MVATMEEIVVYCPKCKAMETLWIMHDVIVKTQKYNQEAGHIFHDCGSNKPCRVLRRFNGEAKT